MQYSIDCACTCDLKLVLPGITAAAAAVAAGAAAGATVVAADAAAAVSGAPNALQVLLAATLLF
jgi:hypothetical protein